MTSPDTTLGHRGPDRGPDGGRNRLSRPAIVVWAILMVATISSWQLGELRGSARAATVAVLVIAFVKVSLVGSRFMELHGAPAPIRFAFAGWCVVICAVLVTIFLAG